jgi:predicted nucleic acid-binding Zn ribbon protein
MIYTFKCEKCNAIESHNIPLNKRDDSGITCKNCSVNMVRVIQSEVNFTLKGWGWTGKDWKEKRNREQHSIDMALKQHERYGNNKLVPNFKGDVADSWEQVRDQAILEKGIKVAPQYNDLINAERKGRVSTSEIINKTVQDMRG